MDERQKIEQAILALEAQRAILGEDVTDASVATLREKLSALSVSPPVKRRKLVTLLLADFSGFTALSEQMDAEDVRLLMNTLWDRLDQEIISLGGHIDKHLGDAVLAFWGMEVGREDDPVQAIRAALRIQAEVAAFAVQLKIRLQMRIGVHTGPVILGELGTRGEFTAMGEAVNLVSLLEELAPVGGVLISQETYLHVRGLFTLEAYQPLGDKVAPPGLQTYQVTGIQPHAFQNPVRGIEGTLTRMVGREVELRQLQQAFREVVTGGTAQIVTLFGEAGLGKSRLLLEFQKWVETTPTGVLYFKSRAEEQKQTQPFALVREMFSSAFQILDSDTKTETLEKFVTGACSFLGEGRLEAAHLLGQLLGFDFSESPYVRGIRNEAAQLHVRGLYYATQFFKAAARQKPVILFFDDLHWADAASRDFAENLVRNCGEAQILVVFASRPALLETHPAWGDAWEHHQRVFLMPLTREDSRLLLYHLLRKVPDLPGTLQETLLENAEGNPYYLEELIKMLIEGGVIIKTEREWRVSTDRLSGLKIPSTLTGVLQARMDRLSPGERELLQRASIMGRVFWDDAVSYLIAGHSREMVEKNLSALTSKELILRGDDSVFENSGEYQFKHAILRDVTYDQVLKSFRRETHGRAAEWFISRAGDRLDELAATIARHFELAANGPQAGNWYARAANLARNTYSTSEAADYYRKALGFLEGQITPLERYRLYAGLGDVLRLQGQLEEAEQVCQQMLAVSEALQDWTRQAGAMNQLWAVYTRLGRYPEAQAISERAARLARRANPPDLAILAQAVFQQGVTNYRLGRLDLVGPAGLESMELAERAGARAQIASSCNLLAMNLISKGFLADAIPYELRSLEIWRELKHREHESDLLNNLGECYRISGDARQAIEYYELGLQIGAEIGNKLTELGFLSNLCAAYNLLGEYSLAWTQIEKALGKVSSDAYNIAEMHYNAAETLLGLGQLAEAHSHAVKALGFAYQINNPELIGHAWRVAGRVTSAHGKRLPLPSPAGEALLSARECFEKAAATFEAAAMERDRGVVLWQWARHERQAGNLERAGDCQQAALAIFQRLDLPLLSGAVQAESGG